MAEYMKVEFRNNPDYSIRYKEDCGYYVTQGERGRYSFLLGTPTKDRNEAFLFDYETSNKIQ